MQNEQQYQAGQSVSLEEYLLIKRENSELHAEVIYLKQELDMLKRMIFGSKSERHIGDDPGQLSLGFEMRSYFRHLARSKVAIYVRGPHDGISSKLGQLLALGKPIIGQTIHNNKELYYQNPFFDEQFAYEEPEEIARHVYELLQQPEKAASFVKANTNTFDTKFSPEITISDIIEKIFE